MKIVQTNKAYFPKVGGIETTITTLSEGLVKYFGQEVEVLTCNHKVTFKEISSNINGVKIRYLPTYGFLYSLPISLKYFWALSKLSGDILHIHEPFPLADLTVLINSKIKNNFNKIVVSWHSDIVRQKLILRYYRRYIEIFLEIVDKIIISNPNLLKNSDFLPKYEDKCVVIPIGVNLDWAKDENIILNTDSKNITKKNMPLILFVGRLVYYKGLKYLIDAMKYVNNAKLLIIGSGPLDRELNSMIKKNHLESIVKIIPEVDRKTLEYYYKNCDIFVLPSIKKSETYGIVQIEAMACKKPVVCTEIGTGTSYINQHGFTGLVVPPENSIALAEAINKILRDKKLQTIFGENAKARAFQEFNDYKMVKSTYELYLSLF